MLGRKKVDFKGNKNGIVLFYERELSFEELLDLVEKKLSKAKDFFKGAHMIGIDGPALELDQEAKLAQLIEQTSGMKVLTLEPIEKEQARDTQSSHFTYGDDLEPTIPTIERQISHDETHTVNGETQIESAIVSEDGQSMSQGLETKAFSEPSENKEVLELLGDLALEDKTVFHRGTLRSGKRIVSKGHLVVIGDVNPGAEVSAQGNIVVLGALRGFAYAGSGGDDSRIIIALKLMPTQIRIGSKITRSPDDGSSAPSYPEVASVKDNRIIIEPLA